MRKSHGFSIDACGVTPHAKDKPAYDSVRATITIDDGGTTVTENIAASIDFYSTLAIVTGKQIGRAHV